MPVQEGHFARLVRTGKMTEILDSNNFVCHETTKGRTRDRLQCSGHMILKGTENYYVRLANSLEIDLDLQGVELIFETKKECIEWHSQQ